MKRRLTLLTGGLSSAAGGLFESLRNLAAAIKNENQYAPTVVGLRDADTGRDAPLWGEVDVKALDVLGPRLFGYAPKLGRTLELDDPQILHVHGLWLYSSAAAIRWSRGIKPYVVSPHGMLDSWALKNSQWKKSICAALYEKRHLHGAACLHALNQAEATAMREYGLRNPICVIPNGVSLPMETIATRMTESRTLLYLGRLHPKKGLPNLIKAWSLASKEVRGTGWRLVIAGWDQDGHRGELEALAKKLQTGGQIRFVGPQVGAAKDVCFRDASAFILPSMSEGLPMAVLEAWAWKLPVLMTPECNLPEGADAGAAIMVQAHPDSILVALRRLFSMSDAELEVMGSSGRRLVEGRFGWSRIGKQMVEVYDWMLGSSCPRTVQMGE